MPLCVLTGLPQQLIVLLVTWVCSPFSALLALRWLRRRRPSLSQLPRVLLAILVVSVFNLAFALLLLFEGYIPPPRDLLWLLKFVTAPAPIAVGIVVLLQWLRRHLTLIRSPSSTENSRSDALED